MDTAAKASSSSREQLSGLHEVSLPKSETSANLISYYYFLTDRKAPTTQKCHPYLEHGQCQAGNNLLQAGLTHLSAEMPDQSMRGPFQA